MDTYGAPDNRALVSCENQYCQTNETYTANQVPLLHKEALYLQHPRVMASAPTEYIYTHLVLINTAVKDKAVIRA